MTLKRAERQDGKMLRSATVESEFFCVICAIFIRISVPQYYEYYFLNQPLGKSELPEVCSKLRPIEILELIAP